MRLKTFLPALITTIVVFVFSVFFLDMSVKEAIERGGTKANGAKVEVDDVVISITGMSVTIRGLKVTDKEDPMMNAVEVESMKLDVASKPLFWRRLIIERSEITGIKTGTAREKSGALETPAASAPPAPAPSSGETASAGEAAPASDAASPAVSTPAPAPAAEEPALDVASMKEKHDPAKLKAEDLSSYNKVKEEQAGLADKAKDWQRRVGALKADQGVADAKAWLERVKKTKYSGVTGAKKAAEDLKEAGKIGKDLKAVQEEVSALKGELSTEMGKAKSAVKAIDALKDKDFESAIGHLKAAGFSAEGLAERAVGPVWMARAKSAIGWIKTARALIARRKKGEKPPRPPRNGLDVEFPFKYKWPGFHLKHAGIDGTFGAAVPIDCAGTLKDVTSDPKLVGRPIVLNLRGSKAGGVALALKAKLDYTTDTPRESIDLDYRGLDLKGMKLGKIGAPVSLRSGTGAITSKINAAGLNLAGNVLFAGDPVDIQHSLAPSQAGNQLLKIVNNALENMKRLEIKVKISGRITRPKFGLSSNVERELKGAVDRVLKKELDALKAKYRARINALVDGEKKKLADQVAAESGSALGKLGVKEKSLKDVQAEIATAKTDLENKSKASLIKSVPGGLGGLLKK